ncbi:ribosomal protein S18-alanine N-acetyltransferase [Dongia soli]|uniref:Ribosomal protein S18-alanine N-acetyltransferase n=1 Tax=Dongia soli TaxID=600628 RepID=A0ABU5E793_9PROT|nr:ribosomal protein S18-alanine N-acetyltransferase [Dongia soli]MDY0882175.1 ribosomal protein S18-alanine N-acetyltransferase [Dongia soli]
MTGDQISGELYVRPAGPFDLEVLAALHAICFTAPWDQTWTANSFAEVLAMPGASGIILLDKDNEPLGFAVMRSVLDETEIILLAVRPDCRGRGFGKELAQMIVERAHAEGQQAIFLEHAHPNVAAARLYQAAGFKQMGIRRNYYRNRNNEAVDAVTMRRDLAQE